MERRADKGNCITSKANVVGNNSIIFVEKNKQDQMQVRAASQMIEFDSQDAISC